MRTQQEILDRIKHLKENQDDIFGFQINDLIDALNYKNARPYLKKTVTKKLWESKKIKDYKKYMVGYMNFAWEKAINCRGLSAYRSQQHYKAWLWLDGDNELHLALDDNYEYYGKPELRKICKYLGLNPDDYDDGIRVNSENELAKSVSYIPDGYELIDLTKER